MDIEIGQVLSLRIRFNNSGTISETKHPYLVVAVSPELGTIEIAQLSSLEGKEYKLTHRVLSKKNKLITCDNETVIDKDSLMQKDNKITISIFEELTRFRRQRDKLSEAKLKTALAEYWEYHQQPINENQIVHMDRDEIIRLNS